MEIYYDLHIHTGLSPCADDDMTPNNIVNMAALNGLDVIAVTDHNTCGNAAAVIEAAEGSGIVVIPGMEAETSEEAHVICLFPSMRECELFAAAVKASMPPIKNRPEIFGRQFYYDSDDEAVGECGDMLITASGLGIYELVALVAENGGVCWPAHVDRPSNSIISNLGFIPEDLDVHIIEFSKYADPHEYLKEHGRLFPGKYFIVRSSDAHRLGDIAERDNCIVFDQKPDARGFVERLRAYPLL